MKYLLFLFLLLSSCKPGREHKGGFVVCKGGVLYYRSGYSGFPVFQKSEIPKLVLCDDGE